MIYRKGAVMLLMILCVMQRLCAQNGLIRGVVSDSLGKPVEGSIIYIEGSSASGLSDMHGVYIINDLPAGTYRLVAVSPAYKLLRRQVSIRAGEEFTLDFRLSAGMHVLREILVECRQNGSVMGFLRESSEGLVYAGKKTEEIVPDSLNGNTAQNNLRELTGRLPGANYSETEGGGFPSSGIGFRGLNPVQSAEMNIRQNGYNISADLYGYPESYYLPPLEAVERIEMVHGGAALQFGPQFGGMMNYIIKSGPATKPFEFTTRQTNGSFGFFNSFNAVGGTISKWNYYAYLQYSSSDGWRPHSDYLQYTGFSKLEYKASEKLKLGIEYSLLRNTIHMPGGLSDDQFRENAGASFRARNWLQSPWNILSLYATWRLSAQTSLFLKSAFNSSARDLVWKNEDGGPGRPDSINPVTHNYVPREVQREAFLSSTSELRVLHASQVFGKSNLFAAGVRYFSGVMNRQGGGLGSTGSDFDLNLHGGSYGYDLRFKTQNIALFAENVFHMKENLSITPGFRVEYLHSQASGYVTDSIRVPAERQEGRTIALGGMGMEYTMTQGRQVYANISQAYRPIEYANQTPLGVASRIDPRLKDSRGFNAESGIRGNLKNLFHFDAGIFYLAYNRRIGLITQTDPGGQIYTYRTNVADSRHLGTEIYLESELLKWFAVKESKTKLSLFNSFAWIDAKYVSGSFAGNSVEFAPRIINRSGLRFAKGGFSCAVQMSYTAAAFSDANNTVSSADAIAGIIPKVIVFDFSASWRWSIYNVSLGINNLADQKYFTLRTDEYPGPGIIPSAGRSCYISFGACF